LQAIVDAAIHGRAASAPPTTADGRHPA
jgi:hypothetical protein